MIKKLTLIILTLFLMISGAHAVLNDSGAYWGLENLTDYSGNGHTLTNVGSTFTTSGKINSSYDLDGVNDYLNSNN